MLGGAAQRCVGGWPRATSMGPGQRTLADELAATVPEHALDTVGLQGIPNLSHPSVWLNPGYLQNLPKSKLWQFDKYGKIVTNTSNTDKK